jgi:hypothetical protein
MDAEHLRLENGTVLEISDKVSRNIIGIAPYDATATYAVGDYCIYENYAYICTVAITTAEAWTAAHWNQTSVIEQNNELKSNLANKLDKSSVKDNLTSTSTTDALSAKQGKVLNDSIANKLDKSSVKDNLTSTSTTDALSAKQGKVLNDSILRYKDYNVTIDTTIWQGVYTADADISSMISQGYKPVSATVYYILNNRPGYAYIIQTESKVRLCTTSADVKGTSATVRVVFTKAASL